MINQKKRGTDHIMFSKERRMKELEQAQFKIMRQRHALYDRLVEFVMRYVGGGLRESVLSNKRYFREIFCDQRNSP